VVSIPSLSPFQIDLLVVVVIGVTIPLAVVIALLLAGVGFFARRIPATGKVRLPKLKEES
jgi:hypothetical protein